eukprot:CAMPEP_0168526612 /NCGR_PEP_ID=MMETSP0405-20121227/12086_1 /TAXON_ID=498012 /ORGANISM="Trichosphaerium sp, Strain Am-I-7 wt" /LENGTH=201 /DNA_ID=CAMNT_0008549517 /DNA_START=1 /DNA_END=606 /DNA_ORIENTATION=+
MTETTEASLKIRLFNGKTHSETLRSDDTLLVVKTLVESLIGTDDFMISVPYPRRIFANEELATTTLKQAGLAPKGMVIIQKGITTDIVKGKGAHIPPGVKHIHSEQEYNKYKSTPNRLIVVDFSAVWCGPCKAIAPVFESLAKEYTGVTFLHVDVDQNKGLPDASDVRGIPTFKFFKNNSMITTFSGADANRLKNEVKRLA